MALIGIMQINSIYSTVAFVTRKSNITLYVKYILFSEW